MVEVVEQGCYVVFSGSFTPLQFNPDWLARIGAIDSDDADKSEVVVIHEDLSRFAIPGMRFDITPETFSIIVQSEPFIKLADIIGKTFSESLPHTPMDSLTINYYEHVDLRDADRRFRFGRQLAPLEPWGKTVMRYGADGSDRPGGVIDIAMQGMRSDEFAGTHVIRIQPSNRINSSSGIFIQASDAYHPVAADENARKASRTDKPAKGDKRVRKSNGEKSIEPASQVNYVDILILQMQSSVENSRTIVREILEIASKA